VDEHDDLPIIELDSEPAPGPPREAAGSRRRAVVAIMVAIVAIGTLATVALTRGGGHDHARTHDTVVLPAPGGSTVTTPPTLDPDAAFVDATGVIGPHAAWALDSIGLSLTTDSGAQWRTVTPTAIPADATTALSFVDARHGWLATDAPSPAVWRTADGGRSWHVARPSVCGLTCAIVNLDFVDARHGFASLLTPAGFGALAASDDGGATWRFVAATTFVGPLRFVDARRGWAVSEAPIGSHTIPAGIVLRTLDGGTTWHVVVAPQPGASPVMEPVFLDADTVLVATAAHDRGATTVIVSVTTDGSPGARPSAPLRVTATPDEVQFSATSRSTWFVIAGSQLAVTTDAGRHWKTSRPTGATLHEVAFRTRDEGWLVADAPACAAHAEGCPVAYLYGTVDGGRTWTLRSPTVGVTANRSP
jgi:photosystem II stability/assembly factor-like uncharacterized protein